MAPECGGRKLTLKAYCKINLTLEILGKRADGYHDLVSVVQTLSLADEISLSSVPQESSLTTTGWAVARGEDNLCLRAVLLHQRRYGWRGGMRIRLTKNIPPSSGLGGGSSDAAATLAALQRLTGLPEERDRLQELAAELGSDVALFFSGGTVLISGRGEVVKPLAAAPQRWCCVLARPDFGIATGEAYRQLAAEDYGTGRASEQMCRVLAEGGSVQQVAALLYNSFARSMQRKYPQLQVIAQAMQAAGAAGVMLSGSGSASFGLFEELPQARQAAQKLADSGVWATVAEPVASGYEIISRPGVGDG